MVTFLARGSGQGMGTRAKGGDKGSVLESTVFVTLMAILLVLLSVAICNFLLFL